MSYSVSMPSLRSAFEILIMPREEQRACGVVNIGTNVAFDATL